MSNLKTWRDYDREIRNYKDYKEIVKLNIYVEFEGNILMSDEAEDRLVEMAAHVKECTDYCSATGIGMAVATWLWHIQDDLRLDNLETDEQAKELASIYILGVPEDHLFKDLQNEWIGADWQ